MVVLLYPAIKAVIITFSNICSRDPGFVLLKSLNQGFHFFKRRKVHFKDFSSSLMSGKSTKICYQNDQHALTLYQERQLYW
jgi:hypothetical protein